MELVNWYEDSGKNFLLKSIGFPKLSNESSHNEYELPSDLMNIYVSFVNDFIQSFPYGKKLDVDKINGIEVFRVKRRIISAYTDGRYKYILLATSNSSNKAYNKISLIFINDKDVAVISNDGGQVELECKIGNISFQYVHTNNIYKWIPSTYMPANWNFVRDTLDNGLKKMKIHSARLNLNQNIPSSSSISVKPVIKLSPTTGTNASSPSIKLPTKLSPTTGVSVQSTSSTLIRPKIVLSSSTLTKVSSPVTLTRKASPVPVTSPVKAPVTRSRSVSPIKTPVTSPVRLRSVSPVKTPITSPVKAPVMRPRSISPVKARSVSPVTKPSSVKTPTENPNEPILTDKLYF